MNGVNVQRLTYTHTKVGMSSATMPHTQMPHKTRNAQTAGPTVSFLLPSLAFSSHLITSLPCPSLLLFVPAASHRRRAQPKSVPAQVGCEQATASAETKETNKTTTMLKFQPTFQSNCQPNFSITFSSVNVRSGENHQKRPISPQPNHKP